MKNHFRGLRRWLAAAAALAWAVFALLWAQILVFPNPILPPPYFVGLLGEIPATPRPERFVVMIFKETSLLLCGFAIVGLVLSALAWHVGARVSPPVATVVCAVAVVVSLAPVAGASRTAAAEGATLSISEYFTSFSPKAVSPHQTVTYASPRGTALKVDVWRPFDTDTVEKRSAVIVVHGGGWRSGNRGQFPRWNAWLAAKGHVVFDIDYRLSPPPNWQDAPADVACAVVWVKQNAARYGVDPERISLVGRSAGGNLALLAAYDEELINPSRACEAQRIQDTRVAAVAAFYPPTDLARLSSLGYLSGMGRYLGGTPHAFPGRYRLSSPVDRADTGDPPTFLVHGGDDQIVPPEESEMLANKLREADVPHRLVELPWANHTFDFFWGGWGSQITRSTLDEFLDSHLQPRDRAGTEPYRTRTGETGDNRTAGRLEVGFGRRGVLAG